MKHARMLRNSILDNKNKMAADKTIKYDAAKSVLKYEIGDAIRLNEEAFVTLFKAFFAEIEASFLTIERWRVFQGSKVLTHSTNWDIPLGLERTASTPRAEVNDVPTFSLYIVNRIILT